MAASSSPAPPRVFISYSWDDDAHKAWVAELATRLRADGINVILDQWEVRLGDQLPQFMESSVRDSDYVVIICTPRYKERSDGRGGGVGYEGHVITAEAFYAQNPRKFIPVLRLGEWPQAAPSWALGKSYADLRGEPYRQSDYAVLRSTIHGTFVVAPPIGPRPLGAQLFTVPYRPNPFFTGREDALDGLKNTLERSGIAALTGMGGVGKTQTAAHYAHRHRNDYPFVLWVRAESADTLFADLTQLAARLELPEREAQDQSVVVAAVERWLDGQERWLLVLDNVEDYGVVRELARKANENGRHVIITTQRQALGQIGRQRLTPMERDLGAVLLLRRAGRLAAEKAPSASAQPTAGPSTAFTRPGEPGRAHSARDDSSSFPPVDAKEAALARSISDEVGGLPLALDQAGAYIEETGCGLEDYLTLLRQRFEELAKRRGGLDADHISVAATFLTSLEKLAAQSPAAAELLNATAFLVPDAIPEEIFTEGAAQFGPVLQAAASDTLKWNEAFGAAFKFSLVERNSEKKLLAMHRMVQAVARSRMSAEERAERAEQAVRAVNAAFPQVEFAVWDKCERLTPSAQACAGLVDEYHLSFTEAARLLNDAGLYLWHRARYAEAEEVFRKSLAICEQAYGPDHSEVATRLNNLAQLLQATNRLDEAEPLMRRALEVGEKSLGPEHPNVAIRLNNLALLLQATNRSAEAEPLYRRALEIGEKTLGPDHPNVATHLNNLAGLLQAANRLGEAEPLHRRVIGIVEKALGSDHPNVATSLNNLAELLRVTNRFVEAEPFHRRALQIDEKALGPNHPNVARDLNNLALLLQDTNRLAEAEPLMRRALEIFQNSLGPAHPTIIRVRKNLAGLLRQMGKNDEADKL